MTIADTFRQLGLTSPDPRTDGELLTAFVSTRDEPAFAELLRRHGPTVFGVCRRVLSHPDADDAFQAVWLVLARKANTVRPPGMVGNWLYGVAVRTANKARVMNAKRAKRAATARERELNHPLPGGRGSSDELAVIDAEVAALPDVYRAAFVTCELNGRSRSEASRELGWPEGTVAARLAKARELLAARLTKRGVTLGVGLFAAAVVPTATAAEAMSAVREFLAVGTANAVAPAAQTLSDEVAKTMTTNVTKRLVLGAVGLVLATGGAVLLAGGTEKPPVSELDQPPTPASEPIKAPVPKPPKSPVWQEEPAIKLPSYPVQNLAVSPDGKMLAVVTSNGLVSLHDPQTGARIDKNFLSRLKANATRLDVSFSPEGKLAITGHNGVVAFDAGTLLKEIPWAYRGWDLWEGIPDFDPHRVVWLHEERTGGGWAAGEGRLVATDGVSFKEVGWTRGKKPGEDLVRDQGETWEMREGVKHAPTVLAAAPDVRRVFHSAGPAGGKDDKKYDMYLREAEKQPHKVHTLSGHTARPSSGAISPDGKLMASGDEAGMVVAWSGETFAELGRWKLGGAITNVAVAADNHTVAALRVSEKSDGEASTSWELFVFDATTAPASPDPVWRATLPGLYSKSEYRLPEQTGRGDAGEYRATLAFHPDGTKLYGSFGSPYVKTRRDDPKPNQSMGVKVWTLGERQIKAPVPKAVPMEWAEGKPFDFDGERVQDLAYSPDGKLIAVTHDHTLTVLAADTRKKLYQVDDQKPPPISGVAFSPKGDKLAVTCKDAVEICEAATGKAIERWETKDFDPHQVIWFGDTDGGEHLVATNGKETRHRNAKGKEKVYKDGWGDYDPCVLAAIPGANEWLMCDQDPHEKGEYDVQIRNTGNTKLRQLKGHKQPAWAAAVTNDGKRIATADVTGVVILWDAETGKEQSRFELKQGIQRLAFAADGKTLAVLLCDTNVTLQSLPPKWEGDLELYLIDVTDKPKEPKPLWRSEHQDSRYLGQNSLAFSPDGKTLIAAFGDHGDEKEKRTCLGVKVWELVPKK